MYVCMTSVVQLNPYFSEIFLNFFDCCWINKHSRLQFDSIILLNGESFRMDSNQGINMHASIKIVVILYVIFKVN